ncbi:TIGR02611 family protein [Streptomyces sp. NBC_01180]|uniref:TIGR02611 family protein n=1 Tax=Streptomyces sp. NBC_01180 TaxID=2903763 RepID=UPI00386E4B39
MNTESDGRGGGAAVASPGGGTGVSGADASSGRVPGSRAPAFVRKSRALRLSWQAGVFLAGLTVVAAGVVMLPLPGPGWLVIFGGMAVWATEFVWAQLVLSWTRRKVAGAARKALDPRIRRRNLILFTAGLVVVAVLLAIYVGRFGLVMPWKIHE